MSGGASPTRPLLSMMLKELQDDGVFLYMSTVLLVHTSRDVQRDRERERDRDRRVGIAYTPG